MPSAPTAEEILQLFEDLNYPSAPKLRAALVKEGFRARLKDVEDFVKAQTPNQLFAKGPRYGGKITAARVGERWVVDFIDMTAEPSGSLKYILLVQDVFSRKLWARALAGKRPQDYIPAFRAVVAEAGKPGELNFDGEFDVPAFRRYLGEQNIEPRVKEGRQDLATLDAAMGALKRDLKKDLQVQGTTEWGPRLEKVLRGFNRQSRQALMGESANDAFHKPGEAAKDASLEFELREKAGRDMAAQDAHVRQAQRNLTQTGKFRAYIGRDDRRKRGDRPNYSGEVLSLESVRGNRAKDTEGKEHSLKTLKPVSEDASNTRITLRLVGSAQTETRQRQALEPFAGELREMLEARGDALSLGEAATRLRRKAGFEAAMRGVRSFAGFLRLFPGMFEVQTGATGGASRVRLR